jgi:Lrp/AsnC family transcriptional regulator, regulator for asnA, asnC and gidA
MLDKTDKKILFELEKNARIPDTQLAKKVNKSKDSVRYRITKLEQEGIIKNYKTWIDYSKLGFRTSTIYLSTLNIPEKKQVLIQNLINDKRVYWYGVAEGVWNIGITYFIKSNQDLINIKNELASKYKDFITNLTITSLAGVSVHEKTFLVDENSKFTTFTEETENIKLDNIEKEILKHLYFNSKINLATLSDKCNSTVDVVRGRMKKLERQGIIIRYTIEIDYHKIGYELYKSFIYLANYTDKEIQSMMNYTEKSNKIINVVKQIAPWEFELILFVNNFQDYLKTIDSLTKTNPQIFKRVETAIMSEDVIFPCKEVYL